MTGSFLTRPCFAAVVALQVPPASGQVRRDPWDPQALYVGLIHTPKPGSDRWAGSIGFPGGKLEPGEAAAEAALRELREETGLLPSRPLSFVGVFVEPDPAYSSANPPALATGSDTGAGAVVGPDPGPGQARPPANGARRIAFFLGETRVETVAATARNGPEGRVVLERLAQFLDARRSPYAVWNARVFDRIRGNSANRR